MQWVFEPRKGESITQIALWEKYKATIAVDDGHWSASDVIMHSTEVFPSAQPTVTTNGRFIINNLRFRNRDGACAALNLLTLLTARQ